LPSVAWSPGPGGRPSSPYSVGVGGLRPVLDLLGWARGCGWCAASFPLCLRRTGSGVCADSLYDLLSWELRGRFRWGCPRRYRRLRSGMRYPGWPGEGEGRHDFWVRAPRCRLPIRISLRALFVLISCIVKLRGTMCWSEGSSPLIYIRVVYGHRSRSLFSSALTAYAGRSLRRVLFRSLRREARFFHFG
jgi:hypothetical protein